MAKQVGSSQQQQQSKKKKKCKKRVAAHIKAAQDKRKYLTPPEGQAPEVHVPKLGAKRPRTQAAAEPQEAEDGVDAAIAAAEHRQSRLQREISEAQLYLRAWKQKQAGQDSGWKFNKKVQVWLLSSMYDAQRVDKKSFATLRKYLDGLRGGARTRLADQAREIIEKCAPLLGDGEGDAAVDGASGSAGGGFQLGFGEDGEGAEAAVAAAAAADPAVARLVHARALQVAEVLA